jgi:hypothetical protein
MGSSPQTAGCLDLNDGDPATIDLALSHLGYAPTGRQRLAGLLQMRQSGKERINTTAEAQRLLATLPPIGGGP